MSRLVRFVQAGHWPTLAASFIYFDFCFAIWVLNGALAPFIKESLGLDAAQNGFMISVPILAGALIRFPLGVLSQYVGRKNAAMVEMGLIVLGLTYGGLFVDSYGEVLAMGVLLGVAGASFGVALSLGSGWYPPHLKGLAMAIAGAGNLGTVLAVLFAPPLAVAFGWQAVYGIAAATMLLPLGVMWFVAKEPPDRGRHSLRDHLNCLFAKDGWTLSAIYIVTAGGYIGLSSFLPSYFYDQFHTTKVEAGVLTMIATVLSALARVLGGGVADRFGGIRILGGSLVFASIALALCAVTGVSLIATTSLFVLFFVAIGAGSGAMFQLVPLRWPTTAAVASSMIGEIGTLGGGLFPNAMGLSKAIAGSYVWGFAVCAALAVAMLGLLLITQRKWSQSWAIYGAGPAATPSTT